MKYNLLFLLLLTGVFASFAQDKFVALDKDLTSVEYPFDTKIFSFNSQGIDMKMAYVDVLPLEPDGGIDMKMAKADVLPPVPDGKVVLLLHGKNFNLAYWEQTIIALQKQGYRVITPDQIGFGKSTKPANYQYSFHQLAMNTKSLLDSLKIKSISVVGHSMGGMLATRFTLSFPEMVSKMVLVNPIGLEDYKVLSTYQSIDDNYRSELKNTSESYHEYQLKYYYDNKWKPEYDRWLNLLAGWTLHKDYPIIAWNAALTTDMIFTQPVLYEFGNINCPTLLIIGTRDRTAIGRDRAPKAIQPTMGLYNQLGKQTQESIPNSTLIELENVGHLPHIEDFDRYMKALLEFLVK